MPNTLTPKEIAQKWDSDAKTVRRFLRSSDGLNMKVGKGQRWAVEATQVRKLKGTFSKWLKEQAKLRAEALQAKADRAAEEATNATTDEVEDEVEEIDLTDDDLEDEDEDAA